MPYTSNELNKHLNEINEWMTRNTDQKDPIVKLMWLQCAASISILETAEAMKDRLEEISRLVENIESDTGTETWSAIAADIKQIKINTAPD